ncbi:hypothetical protein FKM82_022964 [Ascaphus truei]
MSRAAGRGGSLKDKLDGNELDLSLSDMTEIPVRELAALPKASVLDLSCNNLITIPGEFCSLTHIVRLDLSKNQLLQLPPDFGRLINLQHLDLLQNRLEVLPVSFAQLKSLKWLDLKDNPLNPTLAKTAGDCLDEKQCKECALRVLLYMKTVQSDQDRETQRKLMGERAQKQRRETEQRQREEQERELRRREKAQQKERKRRDYIALQAAQREIKKKTERENSDPHKASPSPSQKSGATMRSWLGVLARLLVCASMAALGSVAVCRWTQLQAHSVCVSVNAVYEDIVTTLCSHQMIKRVLQPAGSPK